MENFRVKQWAVENLSNQSEAAYWHFLYFFLDGWTLIDPSNNLRGGFEGSVIFTYSNTYLHPSKIHRILYLEKPYVIQLMILEIVCLKD